MGPAKEHRNIVPLRGRTDNATHHLTQSLTQHLHSKRYLKGTSREINVARFYKVVLHHLVTVYFPVSSSSSYICHIMPRLTELSESLSLYIVIIPIDRKAPPLGSEHFRHRSKSKIQNQKSCYLLEIKTYYTKDDERTFWGGLSDQDAGRPPSHPLRGSRRAEMTTRVALQRGTDRGSAGTGQHGIRIRKRQAEDESGNQPLSEDYYHRNAAVVCGTGTCIRSAGTESAGRFGLESLRLQIEVRTVRAGPGDGYRKRRTFGDDGETDRRVRSLTVTAVPRSATRLQEFRRAYH
ncbi:hypothetical protein QTP88_008310 [Uroleucon formosanum]